ncbi:tether containing UBX domain for GLUT4 [Trichinella spiralis]|uniref:tether containing UBX domain for GLUT4 n=1 Tax=Trichinella spiralis TaxID=6334 RepID=UPI0001EFB3E6|nr:tether containing UBX domain for GLUT4 [Trichinella spiralis]
MLVTIVYPTNHRLQFKINPNLTLYQILDEACLRKGLETADHALKFHSRILDLALTFRYSRVPVNGTLEIVRREDEDIADHQISDFRSESNFAMPKVPCERKLIIYKQEDHLPELIELFFQVLEQPDDDFFEVTKSDVILMQKRLTENCDLLTKTCLSTVNTLKLQETERRRKSCLYSVVRIHLPGRWAMQATFYSVESVEDLYQFVSSLLKNPNTAFELYQAPKYLIERTDSTLFDAGLSPMALLILKVKDASITKAEQLFNEEWLKTKQGDKSVAVAHVHQSSILNAEHLAQSKTDGQH